MKRCNDNKIYSIFILSVSCIVNALLSLLILVNPIGSLTLIVLSVISYLTWSFLRKKYSLDYFKKITDKECEEEIFRLKIGSEIEALEKGIP